MQNIKNNKTNGFTLVELIVVIVIIAILAAVAVPMMMKYVGDAKDSAKLAQLDVITSASNIAAAYIERNNLSWKTGDTGSVQDKQRDIFMAELQELLPEHNVSVGSLNIPDPNNPTKKIWTNIMVTKKDVSPTNYQAIRIMYNYGESVIVGIHENDWK